MENFESRVNLTDFTQKIEQIKSELATYLVGQHQLVDYLIIALLAEDRKSVV